MIFFTPNCNQRIISACTFSDILTRLNDHIRQGYWVIHLVYANDSYYGVVQKSDEIYAQITDIRKMEDIPLEGCVDIDGRQFYITSMVNCGEEKDRLVVFTESPKIIDCAVSQFPAGEWPEFSKNAMGVFIPIAITEHQGIITQYSVMIDTYGNCIRAGALSTVKMFENVIKKHDEWLDLMLVDCRKVGGMYYYWHQYFASEEEGTSELFGQMFDQKYIVSAKFPRAAMEKFLKDGFAITMLCNIEGGWYVGGSRKAENVFDEEVERIQKELATEAQSKNKDERDTNGSKVSTGEPKYVSGNAPNESEDGRDVVPEYYDKWLYPQGAALFSLNYGDYYDADRHRPQTVFASDTLEQILMLASFEHSLDHEEKQLEFLLSVDSPTGEVLWQDCEHGEYYSKEGAKSINLNVTIDVRDKAKEISAKGKYYLRVILEGETILVMPYDIGDDDMEGDYDINMIQTRPPVGEIKEIDSNKSSNALEELNSMVGLNSLKKSIAGHLNYVMLLNARKKLGLKGSIPPLHMIFTGNPGTGKTTVADFIGEIFYSMGLLSKGHLIRTERSKLVGKWLGDSEKNTLAAIQSAKGGVLFIDEAYSLYTNEKDGDKRDFGNRVIETLLTTLSSDDSDIVVIMAGYPKEMEQMLESNPGLKSRFPFTFNFEDYSPNELMEIASLVIEKEGYTITEPAMKALQALVSREYRSKDSHFGNGRFVTRLISTKILPKMGERLASSGYFQSGELDPQKLMMIEACDIPISVDEAEMIYGNCFDEQGIERALAKLDAMVGLKKVKTAIHNFVKVSRMLNNQGKSFIGSSSPLKWSFAGNTGTGKSTVGEIFADILKAMNLLNKGHFVELKGEEIFDVPEYKVDEILREAMKRSQQGLLFIDGDSTQFKEYKTPINSDRLRIKLVGYATELPGNYALIIAENRSPRQTLVDRLSQSGAVEVDHTIIFEDYTQDELFEILVQMVGEKGIQFSDQAAEVMKKYIYGLCCEPELNYANARTMKIITRTIVQNVYLRLCDVAPEEQILVVEAADVDCFTSVPVRRKIGY